MTRYSYRIQDLWGTGDFYIAQYINDRFAGALDRRFATEAEAREYAERNGFRIEDDELREAA